MFTITENEIQLIVANEDGPVAKLEGNLVPLVFFTFLSRAAGLVGVNLSKDATIVGEEDDFQQALLNSFRTTKLAFSGNHKFPMILNGFFVTAGVENENSNILSQNNRLKREYFCITHLYEKV